MSTLTTSITAIAHIYFTGRSGRRYRFSVHSRTARFKKLGGVYFVTKRTRKTIGRATHRHIYVGETNDLSTRFNNHHKAVCFQRHSANCICVRLEDDEEIRLKIEADLIKKYHPPCND